jgi:hypothetical protein
MPSKYIQDWLKRTGFFVKKGLQRANRRQKMSSHSITRYFEHKETPGRPIRDNIMHTARQEYPHIAQKHTQSSGLQKLPDNLTLNTTQL